MTDTTTAPLNVSDTHSVTYGDAENGGSWIASVYGAEIAAGTLIEINGFELVVTASEKVGIGYENSVRGATQDDRPATPRQVAYLRRLIDQDPGFAATIGITADTAFTVATASDAIDRMRSNA